VLRKHPLLHGLAIAAGVALILAVLRAEQLLAAFMALLLLLGLWSVLEGTFRGIGAAARLSVRSLGRPVRGR
jgi:hypothetical protein